MTNVIQGNENRVRLYEQQTVTIPAGESRRLLLSSSEFVKCEDISPLSALEISYNDLVRVPLQVGDRYKKSYLENGYLETAEVFNITNNTVTVTILNGSGDFENQAIEVKNQVTTKSKVWHLVDVEEITFGAGETEKEVNPNRAGQTRIQNTGNGLLRLYDETGFILSPYGCEELTLGAPFKVYGVEGDKFVIGRFE